MKLAFFWGRGGGETKVDKDAYVSVLIPLGLGVRIVDVFGNLNLLFQSLAKHSLHSGGIFQFQVTCLFMGEKR